MTKALFLDRDGVINKEKNYLYKIEDFEFLDGVFETCRHFRNCGYIIVVVTNQAGIARNIYTQEQFFELTRWMCNKFELEGVYIEKVYHCPHHPDFTGKCNCRKPAPGMFNRAKEELNIDMAHSILVGDKNSDIEAGIRAGVGHNFLVSTGHGIGQNKFGVPILSNLRELTKIQEFFLKS